MERTCARERVGIGVRCDVSERRSAAEKGQRVRQEREQLAGVTAGAQEGEDVHAGGRGERLGWGGEGLGMMGGVRDTGETM